MKICIYGGSFNPPHLGHTAALRAVRAAIEPDVTLVIPDRIPPHKELTPGSPEPSERLLMTMLAFSSEPGVEVSDMELHRSGKSYTVDTVRELRDCNPDAELYLVVGTDMLTTFEQWHDYRALLAHRGGKWRFSPQAQARHRSFQAPAGKIPGRSRSRSPHVPHA